MQSLEEIRNVGQLDLSVDKPAAYLQGVRRFRNVMPNGFDKNLYRVYEVVDGFRAAFDRWPTTVRLPGASLRDLMQNVLTPAGRSRIESCLTFISDEAVFAAEDQTGSRYIYLSDSGFESGGAAAWLAVDHLTQRSSEPG